MTYKEGEEVLIVDNHTNQIRKAIIVGAITYAVELVAPGKNELIQVDYKDIIKGAAENR